ncbi:serine protease [Kutzneria viridogrisea]|uniref:Secreted trypsin-like serine protease n=1 Tax=Kutzneria viridogrisea TaxID=47990 RepID=A0ABR6B9A4_9PSEU|nr:secreted trypsin-like serine protease [Kutzneria viridogrisea]
MAGIGAAVMVASAVPASAISGGEEATEVYPFMASLQQRADGEHFCGGTLIDRRWIVTARHCVVDAMGNRRDPKTFRVRLGTNNRTTGGEVRGVARIELPPDSTADGPDLALLKLDAPSRRTPAALPRTELKPGDAVRTIGWGDHELPENPGDPWPARPIMLRQLDSSLIKPEHCLGASGEPMAPNELCMASLPGKGKWRQTSRSGDSGGPLLTKKNGAWTVHGVDSRGVRDQNGVYASVHSGLTWIRGTLRKG